MVPNSVGLPIAMEGRFDHMAEAGDTAATMDLSMDAFLGARDQDFNVNWTAVAMLTDNVYLGTENWNNLLVLRCNTKMQSKEV
jgi:hypothetical protein